MYCEGWSADNIAFGMGGALLQKLHRDTQKFAFKCSSIVVGDQQRDVFKAPVGDASKASKRGRLQLVRNGATFETIATDNTRVDHLKEVFRDGRLVNEITFDEVRRNSNE
jgi:nicotinamide phosphoribosyltransferase